MKLFKRWFTCKHEYELLFNIHGDMINYFGARSCWKCFKCDKVKYEQFLGDENV